MPFPFVPIRRKLMRIAMLPVSAALALLGTITLAYEFSSYEHELVHQISVMADVIGTNSGAALIFDDPAAARQTIAALAADPAIEAGCLYREDGSLLSEYSRDPSHRRCPVKPSPPGADFDAGHLEYWDSIWSNGERIGAVHLLASMDPLYARLRLFAGVAVAATLLAIVIALQLSARLQRAVSEPILSLAETARLVSERKDYSIRAETREGDEIGLLFEAFNEMLGRIEDRDAALRDANAAAREAVRMREEFLSIAAHELRTPLTPLRLQLQLIRRMVSEGAWSAGTAPAVRGRERLLPLIEGSDQQIGRLSRLVDDLLDVSRIMTGHLTLHPEEIDLAELIRQTAENFAPELATSGCELALEISDAVPGRWDRLRLEQVLANLVSNAIKYGKGKLVRIGATKEGGTAVLFVQDHGIGIAPEDQARIFERFERAVPISRYGGLGLGLYITFQIVHAHGGSIRLDSAPGEGSTFTVLLPESVSPARERGAA